MDPIDNIMWQVQLFNYYNAVELWQNLVLSKGYKKLQRLAAIANERQDIEFFYEDEEIMERQDAVNDIADMDDYYVECWKEIQRGTVERETLRHFVQELENTIALWEARSGEWQRRNREAVEHLFEEQTIIFEEQFGLPDRPNNAAKSL